jgi:hypothetical protein
LFNHCSDLPLSFLSKYTDNTTAAIPIAMPSLSSMSMGGNNNAATGGQFSRTSILSVTQALEHARDSEEGARDPLVASILEAAIREIWRKIEREPVSYILTRDEFAIFNYFQDRFAGQPLAIAARKRYWDHLELTNGA